MHPETLVRPEICPSTPVSTCSLLLPDRVLLLSCLTSCRGAPPTACSAKPAPVFPVSAWPLNLLGLAQRLLCPHPTHSCAGSQHPALSLRPLRRRDRSRVGLSPRPLALPKMAWRHAHSCAPSHSKSALGPRRRQLFLTSPGWSHSFTKGRQRK